MEYDDRASVAANRRTLLAAAGTAGLAVALGGCSTYDASGGGEPPPPPVPSGSGGAGGEEDEKGEGGGGPDPLAKVDDIPVGGGKIFADERVVVTQPTAGDIKAFTAVCTHAGCVVANVQGGTINCTCHGSQFKIEDGSVAAGPAPRPLAAKKVTVDGDNITLG